MKESTRARRASTRRRQLIAGVGYAGIVARSDECELMHFIRLEKERVRYAAWEKHELSRGHVKHLLRIPGGIPNDEGLSYLDQVEATAKAFGGEWLAQGDVHVLEGAWPGGVVLMKFPSMIEAMNWYNSPAYQKILHLRVNNAVSDLVLVDGVGRGFTVAGFAREIRLAKAAR